MHHDKIAALLTANMEQLNELAKQGRLSAAQISQVRFVMFSSFFPYSHLFNQLKQFAANSAKITAQENANQAAANSSKVRVPFLKRVLRF